MTRSVEERFYALLPQVYRQRDAQQGQPLRALLAVLEGEYQALKDDVAAAYDNWFVETCDQWALPYLADLLGIRGLEHGQPLFPTQRRYVANALAYRRRKGAAAVLEHVLRDVTGWDARVAVFSEQLAATQHLAAMRAAAGGAIDLRAAFAESEPDGGLESAARTLDTRGNPPFAVAGSLTRAGQAKYHPANVGVFVWRLGAYAVERAVARPAAHPAAAGCFTFDPAGRSIPLFTQPQPVDDTLDRADAESLPLPLTRRLLAQDLRQTADWRATGDDAGHHEFSAGESRFYGADRSFCIEWQPGSAPTGEVVGLRAVEPGQIVVADLSRWQAPRGPEWLRGTAVVAVDPELGRLMFHPARPPLRAGDVATAYAYGFSEDIGGGAYSRPDALAALDALPEHALRVSVGWAAQRARPEAGFDAAPPGPGRWIACPTVRDALDTWEAYCAARGETGERAIGVIALTANADYATPAELRCALPGGAQLRIMAADATQPALTALETIRVATRGPARNRLAAERATEQPGQEEPALDRRLLLDGLRFEGLRIEVDEDKIEGFLDLELTDCSVRSALEIARATETHRAIKAQMARCVLGPVRAGSGAGELAARDSIIAAGEDGVAVDAAARATLARVTVLGATRVAELPLATDSIFTGPVEARSRAGLMRRCYLPGEASRTPRREHCQPELALALLDRAAEANQLDAAALDALKQEACRTIQPVFTSTDPDHPAYAQLQPATPDEIRGGGEPGAEMGAFHGRYQRQREANLRRALDEYLPLGKQVSIHFVT